MWIFLHHALVAEPSCHHLGTVCYYDDATENGVATESLWLHRQCAAPRQPPLNTLDPLTPDSEAGRTECGDASRCSHSRPLCDDIGVPLTRPYARGPAVGGFGNTNSDGTLS